MILKFNDIKENDNTPLFFYVRSLTFDEKIPNATLPGENLYILLDAMGITTLPNGKAVNKVLCTVFTQYLHRGYGGTASEPEVYDKVWEIETNMEALYTGFQNVIAKSEELAEALKWMIETGFIVISTYALPNLDMNIIPVIKPNDVLIYQSKDTTLIGKDSFGEPCYHRNDALNGELLDYWKTITVSDDINHYKTSYFVINLLKKCLGYGIMAGTYKFITDNEVSYEYIMNDVLAIVNPKNGIDFRLIKVDKETGGTQSLSISIWWYPESGDKYRFSITGNSTSIRETSPLYKPLMRFKEEFEKYNK